MLRALFIALLVLASAWEPKTVARADATAVDLQLVLAIDSSSSVSMDEYYLQLEGYAAAFRHPDLVEAIRSGAHKAIAVTLFEWSSTDLQRINFDWRVISDAASAEAFAEELALAPRLVLGGNTAIGEAVAFATELFDPQAVTGGRRVIDVSGDGPNNQGRSAAVARDEALFRGITVNGLVILNEVAHLDRYYESFVIGGPGSFVITAQDYTDFADAILKKLIREITTVASARRK